MQVKLTELDNVKALRNSLSLFEIAQTVGKLHRIPTHNNIIDFYLKTTGQGLYKTYICKSSSLSACK